MGGFFGPVPNYNVLRLQAAARDCDDLAEKLNEQADKVFQVTDQVRGAWRGTAGDSLQGAVSDKATSLLYAAGILRGAASDLRAAASREAAKK